MWFRAVYLLHMLYPGNWAQDSGLFRQNDGWTRLRKHVKREVAFHGGRLTAHYALRKRFILLFALIF